MSLRLNGSTSGYVEIDAPAVAGNNTLRLPTTNGTDGSVLQVDSTGQLAWRDGNSLGTGFKNRIINGDMRIDQRNAGGSVTQNTAGIYTVDRWLIYGTAASKFTAQQNAGSVTPPAGFTHYLGITSSSAYTVTSTDQFIINQSIEGFNIADLGWGSINAQTVTVSFWVRSSLTGPFGGTLSNDNYTRSYPFGFTISAANTWERKTITIPGDTSGTWLTNNGAGIRLYFNIGSGSTQLGAANTWGGFFAGPTGATSLIGTNGATFYLTGVQLEPGSTASSYERRSFNHEFAACQRYYFKTFGLATAPVKGFSGFLLPAVSGSFAGNRYFAYQYPVPMRAGPTIQYFNSSGAAPDNTVTVYFDSSFTGQPSQNLTPVLDINNGLGIAGYVQPGGVGTAILVGNFTANAEL